ncbi:hypothetical protein [Rugosimonospora africana]|uniref:hypothetical protein n=1 Tax=Rugosimonospora africana TaxID=556532 RepID=UPI001944063F|nr:hypothetical protein [Rugosimonospora africana]
MRLLLGGLGVGSFTAGVLAVFATENGTGSGVLLGFGGILIVLALLGNHIDSFEFGGAKLRLRASAAQMFALAEETERRGDLVEADRLRAQARALLDAAGPIADHYRSLRESMPSGAARTDALERVVARARRLGAEQAFDAAEVARWLREGTDGQRITALAMMQARPELWDVDAAFAAIEDPRSAFEQFHAMLLALHLIESLDPARRRQLAGIIRRVRGQRFGEDEDRWQLSEEILQRLEDPVP